MDIYHSWQDLPAAARGASVALGNFDGVHVGHAAVLRAAHAARPEAKLAVLSFEPHPREFFRPQDPPFRLTLPAERAAALAAHGVHYLFELPFGAEFSHLNAAAFCEQVLGQGLAPVHLTCGVDFAFGHRRSGTAAFLSRWAEAAGIGLALVPAISDAEGKISSSRIRRLLQDGYPEQAALLLGRAYSIRGEVLHGQARGRTIGFPTANLALGRHFGAGAGGCMR